MNARLELEARFHPYARRIEEEGQLFNLIRKRAIAEKAIASDLRRRARHGYSPSPLNRDVAIERGL